MSTPRIRKCRPLCEGDDAIYANPCSNYRNLARLAGLEPATCGLELRCPNSANIRALRKDNYKIFGILFSYQCQGLPVNSLHAFR